MPDVCTTIASVTAIAWNVGGLLGSGDYYAGMIEESSPEGTTDPRPISLPILGVRTDNTTPNGLNDNYMRASANDYNVSTVYECQTATDSEGYLVVNTKLHNIDLPVADRQGIDLYITAIFNTAKNRIEYEVKLTNVTTSTITNVLVGLTTDPYPDRNTVPNPTYVTNTKGLGTIPANRYIQSEGLNTSYVGGIYFPDEGYEYTSQIEADSAVFSFSDPYHIINEGDHTSSSAGIAIAANIGDLEPSESITINPVLVTGDVNEPVDLDDIETDGNPDIDPEEETIVINSTTCGIRGTVLFDEGLERILSSIGHQWDGSSTFQAALLTSSYTLDTTHDTWADVSASESTSPDYGPKLITTRTVTFADGVVQFKSDNIDFGADVNIEAKYLVFVRTASAVEGTLAGTDDLIAYFDIGDVSSTGSFSLEPCGSTWFVAEPSIEIGTGTIGKPVMYNDGLEFLMQDAGVTWGGDFIQATLLLATYIPNTSHSTWADVSTYVCPDPDYAAVLIPSRGVVNTNGISYFRGNAVEFGDPVSITAKYCVFVRTASGTPGTVVSTDELLCYIDLDTTGGSISVAGAFRVQSVDGGWIRGIK